MDGSIVTCEVEAQVDLPAKDSRLYGETRFAIAWLVWGTYLTTGPAAGSSCIGLLITCVLGIGGLMAAAMWVLRCGEALCMGRRGLASFRLDPRRWITTPTLLLLFLLLLQTQVLLRLRLAISESALVSHVESPFTPATSGWVGLFRIDHTRHEEGIVWLSMGGFMFNDAGLLYVPDGRDPPTFSGLSCSHVAERWWRYYLRD